MSDRGQLRIPFIFTRRGAPESPELAEFRARHPGWITIPATFVPRLSEPEQGIGNPEAAAESTRSETRGGANRTYIARNPESLIGQAAVGTGECVPLVQQATGAPLTRDWRRGDLVRGNLALKPGTAIATFDEDGRYHNHTDGRSHAAIYLGQNATGIWVIDQWVDRTRQKKIAPQKRRLQFDDRKLDADNGSKFYVVQ